MNRGVPHVLEGVSLSGWIDSLLRPTQLYHVKLGYVDKLATLTGVWLE